MQGANNVKGLDQLLNEDLAFIGQNLTQEFARLSGRHLLITGGAGFLGYYLVLSVLHWNREQAPGDRVQVTVLDNFMRGAPRWLLDRAENGEVSLYKGDVTQGVPAAVADVHFVIHAAGIASPIYYRRYPIETIDANIKGLRALLDYSLRQGERGVPIEGFLYYSSSEIYGDPSADRIPTSEDYRGNVSCTGPRACYDESKRLGETLCVSFARQYELPIRVARPFNNYGPGLKITDRRVLPDFARDILSGRDIVMYSDGRPTRTFCYSADAAVGYYKVLTRGRSGEAYNIGTEAPEISIAGLAERVVALSRNLFGYQGRVVMEASKDSDYLVDNPNRRCPDIGKARRELDYDPKIGLDDGLERALTWYYHNPEAEEA